MMSRASATCSSPTLPTPDGRTMIVWIDGHEGTWDDFRPRAQTVLDSVRWE